jgi:hypothetical protein
VRKWWIAFVSSALTLGIAGIGLASDELGPEPPRGRCHADEWQGFGKSLASRGASSIDLYNGILYAGGTAALYASVDPPRMPRWSARNDFDDWAQRVFSVDSVSGRENASLASDALLYISVGAPLLLDGTKSWLDGHCDQAFGITAEWIESLALTAFITQAVKLAAARSRPNAIGCVGGICGGEDERMSFFSGHAALSATGAGLLCRNSIQKRVWGDALYQRALPCAAGIGISLTAGILRIAANKHWATDVLVGWAVGGLIGYFNLPGPFDLLRFTIKGSDGRVAVTGLVVPQASERGFGAGLQLRF